MLTGLLRPSETGNQGTNLTDLMVARYCQGKILIYMKIREKT